MAIKQFSKCRPSTILDCENLQFCHVAFVDMPFYFLMQHFAESGQSVDELWLQKRKMAVAAILNLKNNSIVGHETVIGFNICCMYQISLKSDVFLQKYGDLIIFKMAAVRHLGF